MAGDTKTPTVGERWRYKPNRGSGAFIVVRVGPGERVTLRDWKGKHKRINLRTLRGDYERVDGGR